MKTPGWFLKRNLVSFLLYPFSGFYFVATRMVFKFRKRNVYKSRRPVICFGNILSGGVGKTPIVRQVSKYFDSPVVMRGYKKTKNTSNIGDEAKMLSNDGILVHVGNRKSNLILLNKQDSDNPIIMDDGFQNSSINKDISVLVFDESIGFGNGFLLPAGPLRETKKAVLRADAIIIIRNKTTAENFNLPINIPIFYAKTKELCPYNKETKVIAFAGIGYPEKFFRKIPANVIETRSFPDHYQYTDADIKDLLKLAESKNAKLLTTEKDWVRLPNWAQEKVLFSELEIEIENNFYDWIKGKIDDISCKEN